MDSKLVAKSKSFFYAAFNVIVFFLALVGHDNNVMLAGICTALLLLYLFLEKSMAITVPDIAVLALFVYELILGIWTNGSNNCWSSICFQYIFTVYYFMLRLSLRKAETRRLFLSLCSIFASLIVLVGLESFRIFENKVFDAGFSSLYDFKYLYKPLGNLNNVWATLLLCFLTIILIGLVSGDYKRKEKWIVYLPVALVLCGLVLTFSRGVYITVSVLSVVMLTIVFCSHLGTLRKMTIVMGFCILVGGMTCLHWGDVRRTFRMTETVSQQRSLDGRIKALSLVVPAWTKAPLLGVGTGNYALAVNEYVYEDDNITFSNFAPNIFSQIVLEKGAVGLLLWGILALCLFVPVIKRRSRNESDRKIAVFCLFSLSMILLRELSFAAFFSNVAIGLSVAILMVILVNTSFFTRYYSIAVRYSSVLVLVLFTIVLFVFYHFKSARTNYQQCIQAAHDRDWDRAAGYLEKAGNRTPTYILRGYVNWNRFLDQHRIQDLETAGSNFLQAYRANDRDFQMLHNYAVTLFYLGNKVHSKRILNELAGRFTNNAQYHVSLACALYLDGDKIGAARQFAQSILLKPSILETAEWDLMSKTDSCLADMVWSEMHLRLSKVESDPLLMARYGKIYYLGGYFDSAQQYLERSVVILPNLEQPWLLLGRIAAMQGDRKREKECLKKVSLWDNPSTLESTNIKQADKRKVRDILLSKYCIKFQLWYSAPCDPLLFDIGLCRDTQSP